MNDSILGLVLLMIMKCKLSLFLSWPSDMKSLVKLQGINVSM